MTDPATDVDDEANRTVIGKEPCPKCGSIDNVRRYADGHAFALPPAVDIANGPLPGALPGP